MSELRHDPIVDRWVIIAAERAKRPSDFVVPKAKEWNDVCPFCEGNEEQTPPEIYAIRKKMSKKDKPGWNIRVVPSLFPILLVDGNLDRRGEGVYDIMNGVGAHEIIVETPQHIKSLAELEEDQISAVLNTYIGRVNDLKKDPRLKYVMIFKNYGYMAGASPILHSRSQIIATPSTPKRIKEELTGSKNYFYYRNRCVFCDMLRFELQNEKRIILDIDGFVVLAPYASRFPFEMWLMPKSHSCDFPSMEKEKMQDLAKILKLALKKLQIGVNNPPYNMVIHTAPFRKTEKAGYWTTIEEDYHWHIEIMPRLTGVAGFEWGTGAYINTMSPEDAAKYLREVKV